MATGTGSTINVADERERLTRELQSRSVLLFITLASIGDAVIMGDSDGDITFLNPAAESLTGWSLEDAVGLGIEDVFKLVDEGTGNPVDSPIRRALSTLSKASLPADTLLITKDGRRVSIEDSAAPILGMEDEVLGAVLVCRDITERKRAERMVRYRSELDRMVARISTTFVTSPVTEVDVQINEALRDIGAFFHANRAYVFLYNSTESIMTCTHDWHAEGMEPIRGVTVPTSAAPYWTRTILERRHIWVSGSVHISDEAIAERRFWEQREAKSLVAVPLSQETRVLGFIGIESEREAKPWPEETVNMLYLVGNVFVSAMGRRDAQMKLEAARAREVEIGSRIQQALLLSSPPTSSDFDIAALTIPSKGIDGDFYDFLLYPNRSLDVIFGDVMGKGVPAALISAGAKTEFLRSLSHLLVSASRGTIPQPADIVNSVHSIVTPHLLTLDGFVTLSYVRFNPQAKTVTVVDAGNTRLLRCNMDDGAIDVLTGFNMPLGFTPAEVYVEAQYDYSPGDVFLLYSDGATEARSPDGEMFGTDRLQEILTRERLLAPRLIVDSVRDAVIAFAGTSDLADDLTCICLKIPGGLAEPQPSSSELVVCSNLGRLGAIRAFLRGFCEQRMSCSMTQQELNMLELAANEVASNIMRHSYHGRTDQRIWIRISEEPDELSVRFTHTGEAFSCVGPVAAPPLDAQREGGFGLFIISRAVDRLDCGQDAEGRNYIEIAKRLRSSGGTQ
jgi:PAS domain S-box-containing protein